VINTLAKVSSDIFVTKKGEVLQKSYLSFWVLPLFQIQNLADV
jgi:hypothetical protein